MWQRAHMLGGWTPYSVGIETKKKEKEKVEKEEEEGTWVVQPKKRSKKRKAIYVN